MSESAKQRVQAIGNHLAANKAIPPVIKTAGDSNGPRVTGKVVIITGKSTCTCSRPLAFRGLKLTVLKGQTPFSVLAEHLLISLPRTGQRQSTSATTMIPISKNTSARSKHYIPARTYTRDSLMLPMKKPSARLSRMLWTGTDGSMSSLPMPEFLALIPSSPTLKLMSLWKRCGSTRSGRTPGFLSVRTALSCLVDLVEHR